MQPYLLDKLAHNMLHTRHNYQRVLLKYITALKEIHTLKKVRYMYIKLHCNMDQTLVLKLPSSPPLPTPTFSTPGYIIVCCEFFVYCTCQCWTNFPFAPYIFIWLYCNYFNFLHFHDTSKFPEWSDTPENNLSVWLLNLLVMSTSGDCLTKSSGAHVGSVFLLQLRIPGEKTIR